ncbi:MAG: leucyl/phenylalanyl-tRNA--protein transferase [Actinomycetia bacterium]|nr:leucyl/phenylalanyl-tRNA--protein transferase [Actinomycetes bacterium]
MPTEPPPSHWVLPDLDRLDPELADEDLVGLGADLEPGTLLAAYRTGLFPMHVAFGTGGDQSEVIGWWSPQPRGVLPLDGLVVSRSLRQSCRRLRTTVNHAFDAVVEGCADRGDQGRWINDQIRGAYRRLHELGWAHSIETWQGDELVGGLYGVSIGGLFAGESMFYRVTDASKVALVRLVKDLGADGRPGLLDVQWVTPHLASLGATEVTRAEYRRRLALALPTPPQAAWGTASDAP